MGSVSSFTNKGGVESPHNFIGVHNSLQPVSNREQGYIRPEICAERVLDNRICLVVNGRCGCENIR